MARTRQTVLVVDDDAATRDGLLVLLEGLGYETAAAADGQAALKLCEKELPHAIVTDLMMPGMNGLEFVEALGDRTEKIAIVFLTGQASIDTAVQAIKLGAYDYLPKPLEAQRLRDVLARGLKQVARARGRRAQTKARIAARLLRRADRQIGAHAPALPADRPDRADRRRGAGERRKRHRQGIGRADLARAFRAARRQFSRAQLRGNLADPDGKRALRPREGRVHQRRRSSSRLLRAGRRRHAVSR